MASLKNDVLIFFFKVYSVLNQKTFTTHILDKAYEIGCKNGNLERIRQLIVEICDFENDSNNTINLDINLNQRTCLNLRDVNIYDSQLITSYLMQLTSFRRALLLAGYNNSKVIFPLKKSWQKILNNNDYKTSKLFCTSLWFAFRVIYLLRSISKLSQIFINAHKKSKNESNLYKHAIYFNDLADQNVPRKGNIEIPKTFISWLTKERMLEEITKIYHSN
jgi:polysaccharide biosynthesis PFTS motif protein